nr:ABC transporter permease [Bacteroidota bacterium]
MIWNYITIALRNLRKNKLNTLINILGLAIGFSVSLLIMIYVFHQLSFDRFNENYDNIFRLTLEGSMADGKIVSAAVSSGKIAELLITNVPEAEQVTRIYNWGDDEVFVGEQRFTEDQVAWVDTAFFKIFTYPFLKGNPGLALKQPFSIVISESLAKKYFGDEDPLNQTLKVSNHDYKVTGIMQDMPPNSHIFYDALASFSSLERPDWDVTENDGISFPTYLLMKNGTDTGPFNNKVCELVDKAMNERFGPHGITLYNSLQAMRDIYLYSRFSFSEGRTGDIRNVYIFSFLAFFVMLIAIFNFINLVTAQSEKRMREIGLRKVVGALRTDLVRQFIGESVVTALLAFIIALGLNEVLIKQFANLLDEPLRIEYWHQPMLLAIIVLFAVSVGIISGIYPSIYLSALRPVLILKGSVTSGGKSHGMRKILVTLQFAISVFLLISLMLLHKQISFIKNKDLGFDREHVVSVERVSRKIRSSHESVKAELLQNPNILSVTASQSVPGVDRSVQNCYKKGDDPKTAIMINENRVQHDYVKTFGLRIVAGRDFDPAMKTDTAAFIINQIAEKKLGLDNPVGQEVNVWDQPGKIIGVVENYNFFSLHSEIDPLVLSMYDSWFNRVSIKLAPENIKETMAFIEDVFKKADPNYTFEYSFVSEAFTQMYRKEDRINKLITSAALLAILISMLGLYALTSFTVRQKFKEIGIRKAMGSSVGKIIIMLFRDLSKWMVIGNVIAWPMAFWLINNWLQNFAFRIELWQNWWIFVLAGMIALTIGALTILYQALVAARANPVDALRWE